MSPAATESPRGVCHDVLYLSVLGACDSWETYGTVTDSCQHRCFGDKGDVEDITEGTHPSNPVDSSGSHRLTWTLSSADIISTVEFDHTGNYLATGDKGGRVVLFERNETVSPRSEFTSAGSSHAKHHLEKNLRVQIPYRVSIARAGVRLPQIVRDRREDQQD